MAEDTTKIIRIVIDSSKAVDGGRAAQKALEAIEKQTGAMAQAMDKLQSSISNIGGLLKAHLAIAASEAIARLVEMGKQAFEAAAGLGELAQQVGLTARNLQALQFIGVQNGVSLDDMTTAVSKFSVRMGEAAEGSKDVIDSLKRLGVQNLDTQGKLRPTADLMAEIARKVLEIEDPARRAAAMVDFFGKSGVKMAASLEGIAKGLGAASTEAERFGAMISDSASNRLDELADAMDRAKLRTRAFLAEGLAAILDWYDRNKDLLLNIGNSMTGGLLGALLNTDALKSNLDKFTSFLGDLQDNVRTALDGMVAVGAGFVAAFLEVFRALPDQLGKLMIDGMNAALSGLESGLNKLSAGLSNSWLGQITGMSPNAVSLGRLGGGGASVTDFAGRVNSAGVTAEADFRARYGRDYAGDRARQRGLTAQAGMQDAEAAARRGSIDLAANLATGLNSSGGGTSAPRDDGKAAEAQAEKLQKLIDTLKAAADAQDLMTAAAMRGDVAFQAQQAHAEAVAKAIDFFGGKVDAANPKVVALTAELEKYILRTKEGAAAQAFALGTNELEKQNVLLEAQNRLMNEAPEIQAREIALIKAKQEAEKGGAAITAEMTEQRQKAIEQNETLKLQAEQMKAANELWTQPLKTALGNIQTAGADAWETILETGKISFQSLGEVFTKTLRRMAAEFLALATVRPIMQMVVEAVGPGGVGLIGGNTAAQLGFPVGSSSVTSGGGIGSVFGGGGIGSIFGGTGIGDFLASPVSSLFGAAATPAGGFSSVGALLASGQTGASAAAAGGLSIGGAIGGIGSIGMGAYSLLSGHGSTGSLLSGGAGILGGALSLAGPLLGLGAAAGPIGLGIGLVGSLLGSLFGGSSQPPIPPQPALVLSTGNLFANGGRFQGSGYGAGGGLGNEVSAVGSTVSQLFRSAGVTPNDQLIGGSLTSGVDHVLNGRQWDNRPYTQAGLILPGGGGEWVTYNDSSRNLQQAADLLVAAVFKANVQRGGVSGASEALRSGLTAYDPQTAADTQTVVDLASAYDKLGKAANPVKDTLDKLATSFDTLRDFAEKAGLSLDPINAELKKQSTRSAQDFIDSMLDPLAVQMRALQDEQDSALASAQYIKDNITGVYVDLDKITQYYGEKRVALEDQYYSGAITNLQTLIQRLTYGDLANASPTLQLSGTKSAYEQALAQAQGGDTSAIANLSGYAENYLTTARQSFASSPEYQALVEEIRNALQEVTISLTGGAAVTSGTAAAQQTAAGQQIAQLNSMVADLISQSQQDRQAYAELRDLMQRLVAKV